MKNWFTKPLRPVWLWRTVQFGLLAVLGLELLALGSERFWPQVFKVFFRIPGRALVDTAGWYSDFSKDAIEDGMEYGLQPAVNFNVILAAGMAFFSFVGARVCVVSVQKMRAKSPTKAWRACFSGILLWRLLSVLLFPLAGMIAFGSHDGYEKVATLVIVFSWAFAWALALYLPRTAGARGPISAQTLFIFFMLIHIGDLVLVGPFIPVCLIVFHYLIRARLGVYLWPTRLPDLKGRPSQAPATTGAPAAMAVEEV